MDKKTKVAFLNPPFKSEYGKFSRTSRSPSIAKSGTIYYPLWLIYAAAVVEKEGFPIIFIDAPAKKLTLNNVLLKLEDFSPNLIVVDTSTPSIENDVNVAIELKRKLGNDVFIVLVGTHPSALPEETLRLGEGYIDAVARGEYDYIIRDLVYAMEENKDLRTVNGLTFIGRENNNFINNPPMGLIENLDEIPFLSKFVKKHLNVKDYFFAAARYPMIQIISGRGCPNRCIYCVYPQVMPGHKYRVRSVENLFEEFKFIKENLPEIKEIGIEDDTFTADENRVRKFCKLIINNKLKISWYCNARANLSYETMKLMKKAGCRLLIVGYESGDQRILNNIRKGTLVNQNLEFSKNARKAKLLVHGCFMVGNPGETYETMKKTLNLALKLKDDTVQFFPMIPYPGTEAYQIMRKNNYIRFSNFSEWINEDGTLKTVINIGNLSSDELEKFCDYARRRYYLRISYIWRKFIQSIFNPAEFIRNVKAYLNLRKYLKRGKDFNTK